jgi:hypothetical protein
MDKDTKYCPECGQQLRTEAGFCDRCGTAQQTPEQPPTQQPAGSERPPDADAGNSLSRRQLIGGGAISLVVGAGALGGLLMAGGLNSHERVRPEEWDSRTTEETSTGEIIRGDITLESGQYTAQGFYSAGVPSLAWRVDDVSGGVVDVWTATEDEFENFENGDEFRYSVDLSESGVSTTTEAESRVDGNDDWYVVFDNTGWESAADDRVKFSAAIGIG